MSAIGQRQSSVDHAQSPQPQLEPEMNAHALLESQNATRRISHHAITFTFASMEHSTSTNAHQVRNHL